jgi:hypothetical protein
MQIRPQAMAIPAKTDQLPQGKYGPVYPKTPACHGFTIIAKIIPGREAVFHEYARNIEKAVAGQPDCLAPLQLHYLRWVLSPIKSETYFMYQGIFDTDVDKYTEDAVALFVKLGVSTAFQRIGGPTPRRSSNSSGHISVQVFWNTASTRTSVRMKSRRRCRLKRCCPTCWIRCSNDVSQSRSVFTRKVLCHGRNQATCTHV